MPRPDEPVPFNHVLWDAVREGCIVSEDLSPSLRLRESLSATLPARARGRPLQPLPLQPPPRDWRAESARLRAGLPYGRQVGPPTCPSASVSPGSSCSHGHGRDDDSENVALNIMRAELGAVEKVAADERAAAARRERALLKVVEGLCQYHRELSLR